MTGNIGRLQRLFDAALDVPRAERAQYLQRECTGDAELMTQLCELLAMDEKLDGLTGRPALSPGAVLALAGASLPSLTGTRVGAFELCEELGHGGMGSVYRAKRVDGTVDQQVAIKFVRRDALDAETVERFRLERRLMATLDHPNIARLYDAAELDDGTPYYVMEYVRGATITDYCATAKLGVRERVALLQRVCGAVSEAHRELIVHRDLKPSNILVTDAGVPKLLDFGIAKPLIAGGATAETVHRYLSPQYAAPEQFTGKPIGVACDVYALGLLLFELLAGRPPFDLAKLSPAQLERVVVEVPPPAPSSVAVSADGAARIRGDLDAIVLRCLRKDPHERYASVEQLEQELGDYLAGRAVQARGGDRWYRIRKFVKRNRVAVGAASLVLVSLVGGILAFASQARVAERRAAELELVADFQSEMLAQVDPARAGELLTQNVIARHEATLIREAVPDAERARRSAAFAGEWRAVGATDAARDFIDQSIFAPAIDAIERQFKDQPLLDARLRLTLASQYRRMGLHPAARALVEHAWGTRTRLLGEHHPESREALGELGRVLMEQGSFAEAEKFMREALRLAEHVHGERHRETIVALGDLGVVMAYQSRDAEAVPLYREALARSVGILDPDDTFLSTLSANLGDALRALGQYDEAEALLRDALRRRRALGELDPATLTSIGNLGLHLLDRGRLAEAEPYLVEALDKRRRVLGDTHPDTLISLGNLGSLRRDQDRLEEAEVLIRAAAETSLARYGPQQATTSIFHHNLGWLLLLRGRPIDAEPLLRQALEWRRAARLKRDVISSSFGLAEALGQLGRPSEAVALVEPLEAAARQELRGLRLGQFLAAYGRARMGLAHYPDAERLLLEAHGLFAQSPKATLREKRACAESIARLYAAWHDAQPGRGHDQRAEEWRRKRDAFVPSAPPRSVSDQRPQPRDASRFSPP